MSRLRDAAGGTLNADFGAGCDMTFGFHFFKQKNTNSFIMQYDLF